MHKNYIEIEHTYVDEDFATNYDIWYAVRPSPSRVRFQGESEARAHCDPTWVIEGPVHLWGVQDIAGLRKLLDAIEEQMLLEGSDSTGSVIH